MYDEMRPRSRKDPAADPRSAAKKLEAVRRVHLTRVPSITMVPMHVVTLATKGLMREYISKYGVASLVPERKLPLTNEIITGMLETPEGAQRGSLRLNRSEYFWISMLALFSVLAESGERKDEVTGDRGKAGISFASLTWKVGGKQYKVVTPALLRSMQEGDGVYLAHAVAKNDPFGSWFAATPTFLPFLSLIHI